MLMFVRRTVPFFLSHGRFTDPIPQKPLGNGSGHGQMTPEIGGTFGLLSLIGLDTFGSLFLLLGLVPWRNRSVDI